MNNPKSYKGHFEKVTINYFGAKLQKKVDGTSKIKKIPREYGETEFEELLFNLTIFKLIKERTKDYKDDNIYLKTYDYQGFKLKKIYEPEYDKVIIFEYNNKYQKILKKSISDYKKGHLETLDWHNNYLYDINDNLIKEERRSHHFDLKDFFYEYDLNGNCVKKRGEYLLGPTVVFLIIESKYDSLNRLINEYTESYEGIYSNTKITRKYKYQGNSNYISKIKTKGDVLKKEGYEEHFKYNKYGNLINYKEISKDFIITEKKWKYKYDNNKNWIKSIEYENDKPILIIKRFFGRSMETYWNEEIWKN